MVPGTTEPGDVGCGWGGSLGSSQQLCEAGPGDRGCWFHVGNGVAGRVVAPQKTPTFSCGSARPRQLGTSFGCLMRGGS